MNEKHGQGTHYTKMGADSSAENTPNAPEFICPSPKVLDFNEKRLRWASVVRASPTIVATAQESCTMRHFQPFLCQWWPPQCQTCHICQN